MDLSRIVPHYKRGAVLPTTYTPDEISRVEASVDTNTTIGKRNLAIIRLASRMGFRAGDIAKLKLSEINFSTGYISITQEKTGIPLTLQMPCEVVNAISMHLDNDKYSLEDGYVFHSLTAPYGCITTSIIRHVLNECFTAANVNTVGKKHGPHAFRSYDYFVYLLDEIPKHMDQEDRTFLEDLLPWSEKLPEEIRKQP